MAGTRSGGRLAAKTNKKLYGADFYTKIGAKGGRRGRTGGFYADRERARRVGKVGGLISRRGEPLSEKKRREIKKAYEHLLGVHEAAKRERLNQSR